MKKRFVVAAAALLTVGAIGMLAGCGDQVGEIDGKYKEVTSEEFAAACDKVDIDNAFSAATEAGKGMNFQAEEEMSGKFDFTMSVNQNGMTANMVYKMETSEESKYLVSLGMTDSGFDAKGAGNTKAKVEGTMNMSGLEMEINYDEEWNLYNNSNYIFIDAVKESQLLTQSKSKISLEEIVDEVMDGIGGEIPEGEEPADLKTAVDELVEKGVKLSLDQREGLKMKLTVDKETAEGLVANQTEAQISFDTFKIDIYLAFAEDGSFTAAGVVYDIDMSLSVTEQGVNMSGTIVLKGGTSVKTTDSVAQLPEGIETDAAYTLVSLDSLIGGGMGGIGGLAA